MSNRSFSVQIGRIMRSTMAAGEKLRHLNHHYLLLDSAQREEFAYALMAEHVAAQAADLARSASGSEASS